MSGKAGRSSTLSEWLATLSDAELVELLRARPDTLLAPQPRTPAELANRLSTPYSVHNALAALSATGLGVVQAVCALGADAGEPALRELLDGPCAPPPELLAAELGRLRRLGLVWPVGDGLVAAPALRALLPTPMGLGRPARTLLERLTVEQLKRIAEHYGVRGPARKADWLVAVHAAVTDPDTLATGLASAPSELREQVEHTAWHGPCVGGVFLPAPGQRVPAGHLGTELALRGWVVPEPYGQIGEMPREVALAVRRADYRPMLAVPPPEPAGRAVDPDRLLAAAQRAAGAAVDGIGRLLRLLGRAPLTTVQAGGIGVRELRRAAKELGCREHEVRLWLESAAAAGLVTLQGDGELLPAEAADDWLVAEPASALAGVLVGWWGLIAIPTYRMDQDGKALPALHGRGAGAGARLRADVLDALADLGAATALCDMDALIDRLAWRRPLVYHDAETLGPYAVATRAEARAFGLVADDALSPLGAALRASADSADPAATLTEALTGLLPAPARSATFLPDLTAVVTGVASGELTTLLDGCADAESRDVASTWRFGQTSVRRALDAGRSADGLLAELTAVADRPLPQPLTYLVRDVARRHGQLRVRPVSCCVCVSDPALAAEIARHRSLSALRPTVLADTVVASAAPVPETLAALRAAGYAPVRQDTDGRTVVERAPARRATPARRGAAEQAARAVRPPPPPADPESLVTRLRSGTRAASGGSAPIEPMFDLDELDPRVLADTGARVAPEDEPFDGDHRSAIAAAARQLSATEVGLLAEAIEQQAPVHIDYFSSSGQLTSRVIEPEDVEGHLLVAWCRLRDDERNFVLGRIAAVSPTAE